MGGEEGDVWKDEKVEEGEILYKCTYIKVR